MDIINSILYALSIWSILGGIIYFIVAQKKPDIPKGWCEVITFVCGPLAWGSVSLWLLIQAMGDPEAWKDTK